MNYLISTFFFFLSLSSFAQEATVAVSLTPAGSFKLKSTEIKGVTENKGDHFEAHNIKVGLQNVTTGITLRDEHTKKHLEVANFSDAILVSATGKDGKGTGTIKIKGIEKKIEGTFKVVGNKLLAEFALNLPDFKIEGIKYMGVGVDDEVKVNVSVPIK